jgi:hypothetical protein
MSNPVISRAGVQAPSDVTEKIDDFLRSFLPYELESGGMLHLFLDEKSGAYYLSLHLPGNILAQTSDSNAALDADEEEDEIYKLNRDILENQPAYQVMERDALKGRSFEDIVLEYDTSYRSKKPLKVYGGQHRLRAITKAEKEKGNTLHGVRIYFGLSREQKVEIATINNTAIAVPSDLLDRMREQLLGSELRDWAQAVGLLEEDKDFADRRSPDLPTVRLARTLLVNFYRGNEAEKIEGFHEPILCKSGDEIDENYVKVRAKIDWKDQNLRVMGEQFARLHKIQREVVSSRGEHDNAEFARKALSLAVVASWAYAAGLFQRNPDFLKNLYSLPDNVVSPNDPLNAKALSEARLKGTDPDTYRGLGTRSSSTELGRMLEVFLVLAIKSKKQITKTLANAAIQSDEAKRATHAADKVIGRI